MPQVALLFLREPDVTRVRVAATTLRQRTEIYAVAGCGWVRLADARIDTDKVEVVGSRFSAALDCEVISLQAHTAVLGFRATTHDRGEQVRVIESGENGWKCDGTPRSWEPRLVELAYAREDLEDCEPAALQDLAAGRIPAGSVEAICNYWTVIECLDLEDLFGRAPDQRVGRWWWF